ncbi:MAG TPA: molybdopterin cofactor-binding domain-containing protein [Gaiellaceae bacterium]|nr:molybdopterin cofactor-binding domain-containing protein [Gaiellaceae bacterium]
MTGLLHERGLSRKTFLKGGGALIVGFSLGGALAARRAGARPAAAAAGSPYPVIDLGQLDSWLAIHPDGTVTVFTGHVDIGTGSETGFIQVVADELGVPFESITIVMGHTDRTPLQGKSTASNAMASAVQPVQVAAANAYQALLGMASARLGVPVSGLTVADGVVSGGGKSVSYGDLIGGRRFNISIPVSSPPGSSDPLQTNNGSTGALAVTVPLKDPSQYRYRGKSIPRVDFPAKVAGTWTYVHNVKVPGMLHGRVVPPPNVGARLVSVDGFGGHRVPGLVKVVAKGDFLGVVAETEWAAIEAASTLKATWSGGGGLPAYRDVYAATVASRTVQDVVERSTGNAGAVLAGAARTLSATYNTPFNTHGLIGPSCAIADVAPNGNVTVFSGTQWPDGTRSDVAYLLGVPKDNVRVIWFEPSGAYGRLGTDDAAGDAALLSQAVGKPVRVQWMRGDEHGVAPYNSAAVIAIRAALDSSGRISAMSYENWTASHSASEVGNMLAARSVGRAREHPRLSGAASVPGYSIPNLQVVSHYKEEMLRGIYMRSVGGIQNTFARESFMDELAHAAGADPIDFRLNHMTDPRAIAVLQAAAKRFGWDYRTSPKPGNAGTVVSGRGISSSGRMTTIVEVSVNKKTGSVTATRAVAAFDVGRVVHPDALAAQIEGGTIMGISRALKEEVRFDTSGRVTTRDWVTYPILRFREIPEVETVIVDTPNPAAGAGEPPNETPAGAVGNAIYDATGVRIRTLPFTPSRVRAELKAAGVA